MVRWQACGVRRSRRWHGCCKEDRGCRLSVWQDRQASGHCWLRPSGIGVATDAEFWDLDAGRSPATSFEQLLGHLMTSDKCCSQYQTPAANWLQRQQKGVLSVAVPASWFSMSMIRLGWLCPSSLLICSSCVKILLAKLPGVFEVASVSGSALLCLERVICVILKCT